MVVLDRRNQPRQGRPGLQAHPAHDAHGSPHQASGPPVHSVFFRIDIAVDRIIDAAHLHYESRWLQQLSGVVLHRGFRPVHLRHSGGGHRRVLVDVRPVGHSVFHPVRWTWHDDLCFDSRIGWLFRRRGQRRQPSMPVHSCGRNDCRSRLP